MTPPPRIKTLYDGRHIVLRLRDGWEYAERPGISGIVAIVPVTTDGRLVLVRQFRIPVQRHVIELPAGLVGDEGCGGETLEQGARRELLEEAGYEAAEWRVVASGPPSPGLSTEVVTFFLATDAVRTAEGGGTADESIVVHEVPLSDLPRWIATREASGDMIDPKVYIGLYFAERHGRPGACG